MRPHGTSRSEKEPAGFDPAWLHQEWLETDGLGGFAMGTASGLRTRRYHATLVTATTPPTGRRVLVSGCDVRLEVQGRATALSAQAYLPDAVHPDGLSRLEAFTHEPWPTWTYRVSDQLRIVAELFVPRGHSMAVWVWRVVGRTDLPKGTLVVRPFLTGRDYHWLEHEHGPIGEPERKGESLAFVLPSSEARVLAQSTGRYVHEPYWYRGFRYDAERERGFEDAEDLASPGTFCFDLEEGAAGLILAADGHATFPPAGDVRERVEALRTTERRRRARIPDPLERAALAYRVRRGSGETLVAGYPWFTDWGRDTFIAMRGLCLATGQLAAARDILLEWAGSVSEGMLPNRFADTGDAPEFNAVDASLWFVTVAHELIARAGGGRVLAAGQAATLRDASQEIVRGYTKGTRHRIQADDDGLLAAGEPGVQLTWMDARVGDHVVTPRIGKPVELQALWWNALRVMGERDAEWRVLAERCAASFGTRFWNPDAGCLYDVVDVDHVAGCLDGTRRPNQIFAVGGLPHALLNGARARRVVDQVEELLWTPLGLRSLAPSDPAYRPHYVGGPAERDGAYHQGTVWPWLVGPFVEAWVRVRGQTPEVRREAHLRFLAPLRAHMAEAGRSHVSEIVDAEPPHTPRGCPFQAWSLGELIRLERSVLAGED